MSPLPHSPLEGPLEAEAEDPGRPVPLGRRVELPGRGTTFVREVDGPSGAPTLVLLHGWIASGGLNWYQVFEPASREFNVLAPDHRGHARGLRTWRRFTLADCADDVAALLDVLGVENAIAVGYSMGGPVAQLLWKRHPDKVAGLVLMATSHSFVTGMRARLTFTTAMGAAAGTSRFAGLLSHLPTSVVRALVPAGQGPSPTSLQRWARAEMRRHDIRMVLEAGNAIGHYDARKWIGDVDVPTVVSITTQDKALEPVQQARLAFSIPGADIQRVDDGHLVSTNPRFAEPVLRAARTVADQAYPGWRSGTSAVG